MKMRENPLTRFIGFLAFVLLVLPNPGCRGNQEPNKDNDSVQVKVKQVKVSPAKRLPVKGDVEYVGILTAQLKVKVASELGGTIERLYFEKGDKVRKGHVLAEISTSSIRIQVREAEAVAEASKSDLEKMETGSRPQEISIERAGLFEAEAGLFEAEKDFKRIKKLHEIHAVSKREFDSAKRRLDVADARMQLAQQRVSLAIQGPRNEDKKRARAKFHQAEAAVAMAKDRLKKSILRAPCDGLAAFRDVEEGEVVPPGTIITQVVNVDRLKIRLSVSEKDIHLLERSRNFTFTTDAIAGKKFSCHLAFLSPTADPGTRSFPAELQVDDADPAMTDGMTVRIRFPLVDQRKIVKIPSAWLSEERGNIGVYVAREGKAFFKKVSLGAYYDQRVEILSGLDDQELIIINPAGLKNGEPVSY